MQRNGEVHKYRKDCKPSLRVCKPYTKLLEQMRLFSYMFGKKSSSSQVHRPCLGERTTKAGLCWFQCTMQKLTSRGFLDIYSTEGKMSPVKINKLTSIIQILFKKGSQYPLYPHNTYSYHL